MLGLFYKDNIQMLRTGRIFLIVGVLFLVMSVISPETLFYTFNPCIMISMVFPVTAMSFDESEKWNVFCLTTSVTRRQYVHAKYLLHLFWTLILLAATSGALLIRMIIHHAFIASDFLTLLPTMLTLSLGMPVFLYPFIFRYGVEKGRIVYMVLIGAATAAGILILNRSDFAQSAGAEMSTMPLLAAAGIAAVLYALSWFLSLSLYEKREF